MVSVGHRIAYKNTLNLGFINDLFPGEKPEKIQHGLNIYTKIK